MASPGKKNNKKLKIKNNNKQWIVKIRWKNVSKNNL